MHSDLLFSLVLCGKRTKVRRKIMKCKMTGAAGLAGAFVAGMVVATALGGGMTASFSAMELTVSKCSRFHSSRKQEKSDISYASNVLPGT